VPSTDDAAVGGRRARLEARGRLALGSYVRRSDERRLERTLGSRGGLRVLFAAMARRYVPEKADGFAGDIRYELRYTGGEVRSWTVSVGAERAVARPGSAPDPALVIGLALADFLRIAGGELDPVAAVLTGRLELAGDFTVAMRLGAMFGQPSSF
jgi:putative sterol carrier protein